MRVPYFTIISALLPPNLYFYSLLFILVPHKKVLLYDIFRTTQCPLTSEIISMVSGNIHIVLYLQYLQVLET